MLSIESLCDKIQQPGNQQEKKKHPRITNKAKLNKLGELRSYFTQFL